MADLYVTLVSINPTEGVTLHTTREFAETQGQPQAQWPLLETAYATRRRNQIKPTVLPEPIIVRG